ncbi:MraY family glycosyltransferase [Oceanicoccus sagamiensis]|nr:MraY family glycosyltransferase [Oceanicoccus sagamiensis]
MQLLDSPDDDRKVHDKAIPRSGGLAIVLGVFLPLLFLLPIENEFKGLVWGAATIVIFGYLDDRFELSYQWKFLGQIIAVVAVMLGGINIDIIPLMGYESAPLWLSLPLTFLFLLGATNAVNLSDGLDGLAAGTSLLSLALITVFALLQDNQSIALVSLTLIGGLIGFLRYNTFPARIFMGDTGSQFLGYMVACLAVLVSQGERCAISSALPLLILGLPILDTFTVMTIRIKEKRSPFSPDKNHLHHQLMSLGLKHFEAVGVIYLIQVVLLISAYIFRFESDLFLLAFYSLYSALIIGYLYMGYKKKAREGAAGAVERPQDARDRRNQILRKMDWVYYHSATVIEWFISAILLVSATVVNSVRSDFAIASLALVAGLAALFLAARKHSAFVARVCCYSASVFVVYLYTTSSISEELRMVVDSAFIVLVAFLMLAIRMTRKEEFRLDTQDLLVLLLVIIVPQLPFESLDNNEVGLISLHLAALMYGCEFILGREKTNFRVLTLVSITSLLLVGLPAILT